MPHDVPDALPRGVIQIEERALGPLFLGLALGQIRLLDRFWRRLRRLRLLRRALGLVPLAPAPLPLCARLDFRGVAGCFGS